MAGQRRSYVEPIYPEEARAERVGGTVVLDVFVGPDGAVERAVPISGPEVLRQSATDAVKRWTYKIYLLNGQPTAVETTVVVNFRV
ncbi:MAG TPA: energy transducer TonB [Acidobacteriaceae bacterium]|jgi:TonB family protein